MRAICCPHCDFEYEVEEETIGRKVRCPSCRDVFRATPLSGVRARRRAGAAGKNPSSDVYALEDPSPRRRRKGKRAKASAPTIMGLPSDVALWLGGVGLLLVGLFVGLVAGYFLFSRSEAMEDEALAELAATAGGAADSAGADSASPDPNTPQGMILGKWECDLFGKGKDAAYVWEFFKDGSVIMATGRKRKDTGTYKIVNETTLWMKGPTGENTMPMRLTPDELELTMKADFNLLFKRPGPAGEAPPENAPGSGAKYSPAQMRVRIDS
jgi:predicted Zn finger-like uncharacterized protein